MARALTAAAVVLCIAAGAAVRAAGTFAAEGFSWRSPVGLLRSDPALLYYLVRRVVEAGGGIPADFRADPRIAWPALTDIPAIYTVGLEWPVAWVFWALGAEVPLHVVCVWVMAVLASMVVVGVYGLGRELTGRARYGLLAAALVVALPASYRTIGFVLMREDLAVPLWSLHLWWLARAVRVRTAPAAILAALAGVAVAATWHAGAFLLAVELGCVLAWFLRSGQNLLAPRHGALAVVCAAATSMLVPVLWTKAFWLGAAMQIAWALVAAGLARALHRSRRTAVLVAAATLAAGFAVSRALPGAADYSHVVDLMLAKLRYGGVRPDDPAALSFDVRLMWQGPFASMGAGELLTLLRPTAFAALAGIGLAAGAWWRGRGDAVAAVLAALLAAGSVLALLVRRLFIIPGLLAPVLAAVALAAAGRRWPRPALAAVALLSVLQAAALHRYLSGLQITWYDDPPGRRAELVALIEALPAIVPPTAAVATDFVLGAAILAHTGRPILVQPKWETERARARVKELISTFCRGTPADIRRLMRAYHCRFAVFDRQILWGDCRWVAGYPRSMLRPPPGTAAAVFCSDDPRVLRSMPGFALRYRSPPSLCDQSGLPTDWVRLYELVP